MSPRAPAPVAHRSAWAPLVAIVFILAAALSLAVDRMATLAPDLEPSAAADANR